MSRPHTMRHADEISFVDTVRKLARPGVAARAAMERPRRQIFRVVRGDDGTHRLEAVER